MKIVIDGRMILPCMTGVGRYLLGLARGLRELPGPYQFELWLQKDLLQDHPAWNLTGGSLCIRQLNARHMSLQGQWQVPLELNCRSPDLYHYPHFDLPWLAPGPIVSTIHDLKYVARPDFFPHHGSLRQLVMRLMMAFTCCRSRRVIVDSRNTAQDLVHYLGAPITKIRIAPLGVDRRFFQTLPPSAIHQVLQRYGVDQPYLLYVGERRPHKNLAGLIEAFALFRRMVSQTYRLVIVGKRYSDYEIPEQVTREKDLKGQVHFIDYLEDADLPAMYQAADAFVLLSYYEGFGLPVLEAMASGIPVVASDRTSLPEAAGKAGLLVSPDDPEQVALALRQVVPGGELREPCIAAGLEQARAFTWERCASLTLKAYQEALAL